MLFIPFLPEGHMPLDSQTTTLWIQPTGGALGADIIAIQPTYPFEQLVYFLIVVSVGGLGSLRGPFIAALLIGITDTACKYWVPQFGAFFIYAATIGLLLWRPMGLFGKRA